MIGRRLLCLAAVLAPLTARAQSGDAKFTAWLAGVRAEAQRAGVDAGTLDQAFAGLEQVPRVLELARHQPEFKMSFDEYMRLVVSDERIARGRALFTENRALLSRFADPRPEESPLLPEITEKFGEDAVLLMVIQYSRSLKGFRDLVASDDRFAPKGEPVGGALLVKDEAEQAAKRVLDATDTAAPMQDAVESRSADVRTSWQALLAVQSAADAGWQVHTLAPPAASSVTCFMP